ncbi:MAG: DNA repair protein RecN [Acidimicrobiales bacterium]
MLVELRVRNLGVVEDADLVFGPGMTAVTGETGAGKTLVVEAVGLLLGGRADPSVVRSGTEEAVVEGRFLVEAAVAGPDSAGTDSAGTDSAELDRAETDPAETILTRVVPADGRSRAYLDGRMVPAAALADLAPALVELHAQHAQHSFGSTASQREALDAWGGISTASWAAARDAVAAAGAQLDRMGGDERQRVREADLLRFQLSEISSAAISGPDEDAELAAEEELLAGALDLRARVEGAGTAIGPDAGARDSVARALASLGYAPAAGRHGSPGAPAPMTVLAPFADRLAALDAELADVASELRGLGERIEEDPARLEEVRGRRALLRQLQRKYGDSLAEVLDHEQSCVERLRELEAHEESRARAEQSLLEAAEVLAAEEAALLRLRLGSAGPLGTAVTAELQRLAMPGASIEVTVSGQAGEDVCFWLSANAGEAAQPLAKAASGGELARAMLATRLVIASAAPTLLFDEVDSGIGGRAALVVGGALSCLAETRQVIVVTHLAQVAAVAGRHIVLSKGTVPGRLASDRGTRTATGQPATGQPATGQPATGQLPDRRTVASAAVVDGESRVVELARMLSGRPDSSVAREHAVELLGAKGQPVGRDEGQPVGRDERVRAGPS